ncbi:hypothetical protein C8R42DRAFT_298755 [Lentinula raphanica]|nr:hypothetical protein C8R42DRAFT_298755 [Lentinula raphanica]
MTTRQGFHHLGRQFRARQKDPFSSSYCPPRGTTHPGIHTISTTELHNPSRPSSRLRAHTPLLTFPFPFPFASSFSIDFGTYTFLDFLFSDPILVSFNIVTSIPVLNVSFILCSFTSKPGSITLLSFLLTVGPLWRPCALTPMTLFSMSDWDGVGWALMFRGSGRR